MPRTLSTRCGRARLGSLLAAAAAGALLLGGLGGLGLKGAIGVARATEHIEQTEQTSSPPPRLVVTPADAVVPVNSEEYRFEVLLQNPGEDPLEAGTVSLWLDGVRAESRAHLSADVDTREPMLLAQTPVARTAGGEGQEIVITVPREQVPRVSTRESGVYLLHAEFAAETEEVGARGAAAPTAEATTPFVWGGVSAMPLPLTLVVPLVLPSEISGVPGANELAEMAPRLTALLSAAEDHAATIAVDPRIVAAIRALGTAAPSAAASLLDRLENTMNPVFMLQFADADPAVQAALGFEELLQPLSFGYLTATGTFEASEPPPMVMVEMDTTGLYDGVPTREELLTLSNARPGAWPAPGEVDSATLNLLATSGIRSLVLDSRNIESADAPNALIGDFEVLISDAALGDAARTAVIGASPIEQRAARAELAALTALDAQSETGGAILALNRASMADAADPLQIFDTLEALPWLQPAYEWEQPEGTAALHAGGASEDRRERLRAMMSRSTQIDAMAPLLVEPEYLLEWQRARLLDAFATRFANPLVDFSEIDAAVRERDRELLTGVHPVPTENMQLVGASSQVPVTLRNWLPFDAIIELRAAPASAAISVPKRRFETAMASGGAQSVLIPVNSRVSSGGSALLLEVRSIEGGEVFASETLPLTLRSSVETVLLAGLGAAAALLLVLGVWRSVIRRRNQHAGE